MEKENIRPIDIKDFKDSQHTLDYIDNDFAIVNSLEGIPDNNDIVRLECFIIAVCIEGCIQLDINYRTYQLKAGDLLLGLPNTVISHTMLSPKYKVRLAGFSTRCLQLGTDHWIYTGISRITGNWVCCFHSLHRCFYSDSVTGYA